MQSSTSPDSYCSLSPTSNPFSPAFSPSSPNNYRSSSALIFSQSALSCSSSNLYSTSFSPSPSFTDMSSPKFNWPQNNNDEHERVSIQFSPTIHRYDEDDDESDAGIEGAVQKVSIQQLNSSKLSTVFLSNRLFNFTFKIL